MCTLIAALLLCATSAFAQTYPVYENLTVNDYADLLSLSEEETLARQLTQLKTDTGVEMTVLTLVTQTDYAPQMTLEDFATGLFNDWGVGNANRNDGVLVLIIRDERVMRLELGAGYARDWDRVAERVVDNSFLPSFRNNEFGQGTLKGVDATIQEIVLPFKDGQEPASDQGGFWVFGLIAAIVVLINGRTAISDGLARFRKCPNCGQRSLRQTRQVIISASQSTSGVSRLSVNCSNCEYRVESDIVIPLISQSSSSGGFGGGGSGGGGASGRF